MLGIKNVKKNLSTGIITHGIAHLTGLSRTALESKSLLWRIAKLIEARVTSKLDHGWRTAHENYGIVSGSWKMVLDHFHSHEAHSLLPIWKNDTTDK